jgi:uncharacterized protein YceH (UPF0502 family)
VDPDAVEIRVLGCLLEKQRTTPDAYPLSLNALRAACNQSTNRDPVVNYDEATIREALERLHRRRWTRLASGAGSRAAKYRHLLNEAIDIGPDEQAILCVLMLRGPQTPGELKGRTDRMYPFGDLAAVETVLDGLGERGLTVRLARRPGQKEDRFQQLLGGEEDEDSAAVTVAPTPAAPVATAPPDGDDLVQRVERLERELARLRADLTELRDRV